MIEKRHLAEEIAAAKRRDVVLVPVAAFAFVCQIVLTAGASKFVASRTTSSRSFRRPTWRMTISLTAK
ncbi:MAG: hypothetical protein ABI442_09495 [Gemmatimonadaceae bacterium]